MNALILALSIAFSNVALASPEKCMFVAYKYIELLEKENKRLQKELDKLKEKKTKNDSGKLRVISPIGHASPPAYGTSKYGD